MIRFVILFFLAALTTYYFSPTNTAVITIENGQPIFSDGQQISWKIPWELLLGIVIVAVFAYGKFNQWTEPDARTYSAKPPRHFTTWDQFMGSAFFYVLSIEVVFLAIVFLPDWVVKIDGLLQLGILSSEASGFPITFDDFEKYGVLYALVIVIAILPQTPLLKQAEAKLRHTLQEHAYIPAEAQSIVLRMANNPEVFLPDREVALKLTERVPNGYLAFEDFFSQDKSLKHRLAKAFFVFDRMNHWNLSPKFVRLRRIYNEELQLIREHLEKCRTEIIHVGERKHDVLREVAQKASLEISEDENLVIQTSASNWSHLDEEFSAVAPEISDDTQRFIDQLESSLGARTDELLKEQFNFIVNAVLAVEKLPWSRKRRFAELGFRIEPPKSFFVDWDTIIRTLAALAVVMLVPTLIFYVLLHRSGLGDTFGLRGPSDAIGWVVTGLAMHGTGMVVAAMVMRSLGPKRRSYYQRIPESHGDINAVGIFAAFLASAIAGVVVLQFANLIFFKGLLPFFNTALWGMIVGVTGLFTALHLERASADTHDKNRDSLIQGGTTGLIALIIAFILQNPLGEAKEGVWFYLIYVFAVTASIGASIGYIFPGGYRRQLEWLQKVNDRRGGLRVRSRLPVHWRSRGKQLSATTVDISPTGLAVDGALPLEVGENGELLVPEVGVVPVCIIRKEDHKTCMKFIFDRPQNAVASLHQKLQHNPNLFLGELPSRAA